MKRYFDLVVIVPLEEEFIVVLENFNHTEEIHSETQIRFAGVSPNTGISFLLVKQNNMGKTGTQEAILDCLRDFDTGLLVCIGIAGGISSDISIGDVCYTGTLVDVSNNSKTALKGVSKETLTLSQTSYTTPRNLSILIARDRISPTTKAAHEAWAQQQHQIALNLIPGTFPGKDGKPESIRKPSIMEGLIACGMVSGNPKYNEKLRSIDRKLIALETESGSLFAIADQYKIAALTVRGISDYALSDKTKFEAATNNQGRVIAATNAASFLARIFDTKNLKSYCEEVRARFRSKEGQLDLLPREVLDTVAETLLHLNNIFSDKLRDVAPAHALQTKGYRLPVPRIRVFNSRSRDPKTNERNPIEVREALRLHRVTAIHVPREYPDLSVAWILASDLTSAQIGDKQIVPYVIESRNLRRPNHGIRQILETKVAEICENLDTQIVFIIDIFNFDSRSKTDFLREQINDWPNAKFLVITHARPNVLLESEFTASLGAATSEVCDVSFMEVSSFLEKNFELSSLAAQVVAVRLQETFKRYSLPAHPSYFSGIPRTTLNALLQANRRAEIIELAVAGYLSFVVAEDEEPISLSRTTRDKFLSELAFAMNFEGKSFSDLELTTFADSFAKRYDFNISATRFVYSFLHKGLLHLEDGKIRFTFPFMESFLLAKLLSEKTDEAGKYFNVNSDGFDDRTFVLYAELGASTKIVDAVINNLDIHIAALTNDPSQDSILLDKSLSSVFLEKMERLQSIQKRLSKAEEEVRTDHDNSHEKQRLLDASDRIREKASATVKSRVGKDKEVADSDEAAWRVWSIAVSLLGAGSERLEAKQKRLLIEKIVVLSRILTDRWTRLIHAIDFKQIKNDLAIRDEMILLLKKSDSEQDVSDAQKELENLIDLAEYILLMQPFMGVLGYLCDEAHDMVLAESITKTKVNGMIEELIRTAWLSDIDVKGGKKDIMNVIKELPKSKFLRNAITVHLMTRVFWKHWRKEDRLSLLNTANESLKGVGVMYKTAELQRIIERLPDA